MITDEVKQFSIYLKNLGKEGKELVDVSGQFNLPIINALWRVCTGEVFEYTDPKLVELMANLTQVFQLVGHPTLMIILLLPSLFKLFPTFLQRDLHIKTSQDILRLIDKSISEHRDTIDYTGPPRDFIDAYLGEIEQTQDAGSSFYGAEGLRHLRNSLLDLFLAGAETTSSTLTWAMLYMVREPEVQKRVQSELDTVVGRSRLPASTDKPHLPYTQATIREIMRCGNIVPRGVHHYNSEPILVNGYTLPANCGRIQPLMSLILHDENHWEGGRLFRPERHLEAGGTILRKDDHFIPFSTGKRQCLGETLAKSELFLFFTGKCIRYINKSEFARLRTA